MMIFSVFLLLNFSCLASYEYVHSAVQEWHGKPSVFGLRPVSSGTEHCPRSISLTVGRAGNPGLGPDIDLPVR
jgi:hypothetical protein